MRLLVYVGGVLTLWRSWLMGCFRRARGSLRRRTRVTTPRIRLAEGYAFHRELARTDDVVGRLFAETRRTV